MSGHMLARFGLGAFRVELSAVSGSWNGSGVGSGEDGMRFCWLG